jgi:Adenosine deaminase
MVHSRVVEALLSSVLSDPEALRTATVFRDHEATRLHEVSLDIVVEVLSRRHPDCVMPALKFQVEELLEKSGGDILSLLAIWVKRPDSLCADLSDLDMGRFPTSAFRPGLYAKHHRELGFQVADSHLHSGATMPVSLFLRALASRVSAIPFAKELAWVSPTGRVWRLEWVLAAVRWALRFQVFVVTRSGDLNLATLMEDGFRTEPLDALCRGTFWESVSSAAQSKSLLANDEAAVRMREVALAINGSFRARLPCPDVGSLLWPSIKSPLNIEADYALRLGLCRSVALLGSAISSSTGEGLTRFARRFEQWSDLKKLAIANDTDEAGHALERDYVTMALSEIAPTDEVVAAEFRKSFKESSAKGFRREILSSLKAHHSSFAAFSNTRVIDLTMPVSFLRDPQEDRCPTSSGMLELQTVLYGVEALQRVSRRPGGDQLIAAIGAIDVVNDELGSTNWSFAIGAALLAEYVPQLSFAIHAGESFSSHLNGLRRVGELFLAEVKPYRIGHALALSADAAGRIVSGSVGAMSRADALMDLCWVATSSDEFRQDALNAIHLLTMPNIGRTAIDAADWVTAFDGLHDLATIKRLLLRDRGDGHWTLLSNAELNGLYRTAPPTSRALFSLAGAVERGVTEVDFTRLFTGYALEAYRELDERAVPKLRAELVARCAQTSIVEFCPTSNVRLTGLEGGMSRHPFGDSSLREIRKTISSDDPVTFGTTVVEEVCRLLDSGHSRDAVLQAARLSVETCAGGITKRPRGSGWYEGVVAGCG